ncbi:hypothetical protein Tco_0373300 [Tanacetum coccineum]
MLTTRGSEKVTIMESLANNKTKGIRCLEHTLSRQATRNSMLELYHCATSASFTTMARALLGGGKTDQDPDNIEDNIDA